MDDWVGGVNTQFCTSVLVLFSGRDTASKDEVLLCENEELLRLHRFPVTCCFVLCPDRLCAGQELGLISSLTARIVGGYNLALKFQFTLFQDKFTLFMMVLTSDFIVLSDLKGIVTKVSKWV